MDSDRGSEYITNIDFIPPSPPRIQALDLPGFDFTAHAQISSPPLPHTPSYNGSFLASPLSQQSELFPEDIDFDFLQDLSGHMNEYEPSEYDAPNQSNSLLMFPGDHDFMSPPFDHRSPFDHSSPSSIASINEDVNNGRHSRASSVASTPAPAIDHSPQPSFHPSPRLGVTDSFNNISIHTPNWGTAPLPASISPMHSNVPLPRPLSPPRLRMPDLDPQQQQVPIINAPDGTGDHMDGPHLHIVPATPISGGLGRHNAPFQSSLSSHSQGLEITADDQQQQSRSQPPSRVPSRNASPFKFPRTDDDTATHLAYADNPSQPRSRTHSETWQSGFLNQGDPSNNLSLTYDFDPSSNQIAQQQRQQMQSFSFGGTSNGNNSFLSADSLRRTASDSLAAPRTLHRVTRSDDIRFNPSTSPPSNVFHHQQSNSMGGNASSGFLFPPGSEYTTQNNVQQFLHPLQNLMNPMPSNGQPGSSSNAGGSSQLPRRSLSPGHIRRASSGSRSDRGAETWNSSGLLPGTRRMSPYPSPNASPRVQYQDLELDLTLDINGPGNGGTGFPPPPPPAAQQQNIRMGGGTGLGLVDIGIGEPPVSAGYSEDVNITGRGTYNASGRNNNNLGDGGGGGSRAESLNGSINGDAGVLNQPVAKQNVTTGRTANASHRRRKQDANFACTVPGCGSTFTRGFNLKGHLRSHFEQKPYKCHWPGCGKGFARQHDCKRHEQLHSNFRPFECEGCKKQFARMDALNRHLRSETGADCARIVEKGKMLGGDVGDGEEMKPGIDSSGLDGVGFQQPRRRSTRDGGGGMTENWVSL